MGNDYVKGYGDIHSDIDFFIFYEKVKSIEIRRQLIESIADSDKDIYLIDTIDEYPWGALWIFTIKVFLLK